MISPTAVKNYFEALNWVVRDGTKFGCHFCLYKGHPSKWHSSYLVFLITQDCAVVELIKYQRIAHSVRKLALIVIGDKIENSKMLILRRPEFNAQEIHSAHQP